MNSNLSFQSIRILYIPPYYENHFELVLDRLINFTNKHVQYQIFTIQEKFMTTDLNLLLSICRNIINEENIRVLLTDSHVGQLVIAKLCQEYPKIPSNGMNFLTTFQCINRFLITKLFDIDECIPTFAINITDDSKTNVKLVETCLSDNEIDGFMKSLYGFDSRLASFHLTNQKSNRMVINTYIELYKQQYMTDLLSLFRIYIPVKQYPSILKPSYLIQPFLDLVTYPYWRLVIANACIFDQEIIMWPLVDGYSGW